MEVVHSVQFACFSSRDNINEAVPQVEEKVHKSLDLRLVCMKVISPDTVLSYVVNNNVTSRLMSGMS